VLVQQVAQVGRGFVGGGDRQQHNHTVFTNSPLTSHLISP
jgi:hypothetical protein